MATVSQQKDINPNPLGVRAIDHLEFIVDDVEKWADYHIQNLGLCRRAEGDTSTGLEGRRAIVVGQGRVNFLFAEPQGDGEEAGRLREFIEKHGCGVKDVAFRVDDVATALKHAETQGCKVVRPLDTDQGFTAGSIAAYGDVVHTFVQRASSVLTRRLTSTSRLERAR